ncbi:MAG: hypothetical protein GC192_07100 [Bacteroidetes bacterium]|nr:hypothetical protein [Bacteroidota bacterium]
MKIKSFIALVGLFSLAIISSAFIQKTNTVKTPVNISTEGETFVSFLSQFKKVDLPYIFGVDDMEGYADYKNGNQKKATKKSANAHLEPSHFIPESMQGKFSRMGPPELTPVARFYPNPQMVAVIFCSKLPFGDGVNRNYNLVLYDLKGNILPKTKDKSSYHHAFNLAYSSVDKTMTFSIDSNGNITQQLFNNQWRKNVANNGINGNTIQSFKKEDTLAFQIDNKGNIAEQKQTLPATASRAEP